MHKFHARMLLGRLSNDNEADHGKLIHATLPGTVITYTTKGKALCGAKPGPRSAGWGGVEDKQPTCRKCIGKMASPAYRKYWKLFKDEDPESND